jgi:HEAT repeat protein
MTQENLSIKNKIEYLTENLRNKIKIKSSNLKEISDLIQKFGLIKSWQIVEPLESLINDNSIKVSDAIKVRILEELGKIGDPHVIRVLGSHVSDENKAIRNAAIKGLSMIKHPKCLPHLLKAIDDDEKWIRIFSIHGLLRNECKKIVKPIIERLGDKEEQVRQEALRALEKIKIENVTEHLINALSSQNRYIKLGAIALIGTKEILEASDELFKLLDSDDRRISLLAGRSIGKIADPNAIPKLLILALNKGDYNNTYIQNICNMKSEAIEPLIRLYLITRNDDMRKLITHILRSFQEKVANAIMMILSDLQKEEEIQDLNELFVKFK